MKLWILSVLVKKISPCFEKNVIWLNCRDWSWFSYLNTEARSCTCGQTGWCRVHAQPQRLVKVLHSLTPTRLFCPSFASAPSFLLPSSQRTKKKKTQNTSFSPNSLHPFINRFGLKIWNVVTSVGLQHSSTSLLCPSVSALPPLESNKITQSLSVLLTHHVLSSPISVHSGLCCSL